MYVDSNNEKVNEYINNVANAFMDQLDHHDIKRLEQDICGVFSNYPYATDCERLEFEAALSILAERCLGTTQSLTGRLQNKEKKGSRSMNREQKLEVILRSVSRLHLLIGSVNIALEHISRELDVNGYGSLQMSNGSLNGFDVLKNYPELRAGLQKYVWATFNHLVSSGSERCLPDVLKIVMGTEYEKLFSNNHVSAYFDGIESKGVDSDDVDALYALRESSHAWSLVERKSPDILCVRTPIIDPSWDQGQTEYSPYYRFEHSDEKNFLVIDFSYGVDTDSITQVNIDSS